MAFLKRFGQFAGAALSKFGDLASKGLSKFGLAAAGFKAANAATGGAIGNAITSIPVVGKALGAVGHALDRPGIMDKAIGLAGKVSAAGDAIRAAAAAAPPQG